jgi:two-component system phosphate regulon response regulator OmpR
MATILIIDDDRSLNELLKAYLGQFGMYVLTAVHPNEGLALFREKAPSLVILDVMLPDRDGFSLCRELRKESNVPIIMLTARGELTDRVAGLELGADDYLPKPFEPRELVARVQSLLRRAGMEQAPGTSFARVHADDLMVDLRGRRAWLHGTELELTTSEFEILALFLGHPGVVLTREQILDKIRGIDWEAYNRSIDVAVSRLRQKLQDDPKHPRYIKTIWGTGYLFLPTPLPAAEETHDI